MSHAAMQVSKHRQGSLQVQLTGKDAALFVPSGTMGNHERDRLNTGDTVSMARRACYPDAFEPTAAQHHNRPLMISPR